MNPLISVIVPVYKVEKYLNKCVESIVNQTYKNLEILLVDDGSPDNCPQMCDEWTLKDSRIKVIHKSNGGLSDARNCGIDAASGEFIGFVDSDDFIDETMYEKLYNLIIENDADLSICGIKTVDEDGVFTEDALCPLKNEVLNSYDAMSCLNIKNGWYYVTAWNRLYNKGLFDGLRFDIGKIHEDEFFAHKVFYRCKKIVTTNEPLYYYFQRTESITKKKVTIKRFDGVEAQYERYLFYKNNNLTDLLPNCISGAIGLFIDLCTRLDSINIKTFFKITTKYDKKIRRLLVDKNNQFELSKIEKTALYLFPTLTCMIFRILKRGR